VGHSDTIRGSRWGRNDTAILGKLIDRRQTDSINRLLAGTLQEYRLGAVVRVIIYSDLRRFLSATRCRWRKGHSEGATAARPESIRTDGAVIRLDEVARICASHLNAADVVGNAVIIREDEGHISTIRAPLRLSGGRKKTSSLWRRMTTGGGLLSAAAEDRGGTEGLKAPRLSDTIVVPGLCRRH
jgi:hypothetical protein